MTMLGVLIVNESKRWLQKILMSIQYIFLILPEITNGRWCFFNGCQHYLNEWGKRSTRPEWKKAVNDLSSSIPSFPFLCCRRHTKGQRKGENQHSNTFLFFLSLHQHKRTVWHEWRPELSGKGWNGSKEKGEKFKPNNRPAVLWLSVAGE